MKSRVIPPAEDHRIRAGALRRERTRLQLLTSAIGVLDDQGIEGTAIDDLIRAAGVSRGTFYNHFRTTSALLLELATCMSDEVLEVVDPIVLQLDDPVERIACGTRLYMRMALRHPKWGRFITQVGTKVAARGQMIDQCLVRDLGAARKAGRLPLKDIAVARDIFLGAIFYGIESMLQGPTRRDHAEQLVRHVLIGLGVEADEAARISTMPLQMPGRLEGPIFTGMADGVGSRGN